MFNKKLRNGWIGLTVIMLSFSCSSSEQPLTGSFVGQVGDTDLFVGVVSDGEGVRAYACDGISTSEWFTGRIMDDELVSSSGAMLVVERSDEGISTTVSLESSTQIAELKTVAVAGVGVFRTELQANDVTYTGGWIVLEDGQQRGAVRGDDGSSYFGVALDFATLTAAVEGVGTLQAVQIDESNVGD